MHECMYVCMLKYTDRIEFHTLKTKHNLRVFKFNEEISIHGCQQRMETCSVVTAKSLIKQAEQIHQAAS